MAKISLKTSSRIIPMVYAYSTPQIKEHNGWTKIGYTEKQDVDTRVAQQTHTSDTKVKLEWKGNATYDDGSGRRFTDKEFHAYLRKDGVENKKGTEWFHIDGPNGFSKFTAFRMDGGVHTQYDVIPYTLRKEQAEAVALTKKYVEANAEDGQFLWNAKPRFGKTLSVYDLCKQLNFKKVLIVTNRPAIANSWYEDYEKFMGDASGFKFVSESPALRDKRLVLTREQYVGCGNFGLIEFLSLQDLKGSLYFGGKFDKLKELTEITWDMLVIDEAHEGVDTLKTDTAFDHIKRNFTLHLSGTPFKALANDKFADNEIYNWTYADEQKAKREWAGAPDENNPYEKLPCLNLFTYQMSEIVRDEAKRGVEINGETEEYAFDLNEFFETKNGRFIHDESVTKFLDALTTQEKFPFSTDKLRAELKHTFWILNRVDSAKALAKKLQEHPVFSQYEIVLAAGDGKLDDAEETQLSITKVKKAIAEHDFTITLSVGQLTTGITIPEWSAVLMLSNMKSPALYMQAAFRSQNPWTYSENGEYFMKENAYVFDFDPARTLTIFDEFANDLSSGTSGGKGNTDERKQHVRELLNFFPVIGEDENGEMIPLDAEKVLSIPRKIRSLEVVRRGFMSNYLFQNISGIFGAPQAVIDIISKFQPVQEPKAKPIDITPTTKDDLNLNQNGDVEIPQEQVVGTAAEVFGPKIYGEKAQEEIKQQVAELIDSASSESTNAVQTAFDTFKSQFKENTVKDIVNLAKEKFKNDVKPSDAKKIENTLKNQFDHVASEVQENHKIEENKAAQERKDALKERFKTGKTEKQIEAEYATKKEELKKDLAENLRVAVQDFIEQATQEVVRRVQTNVKEREKRSIEDSIRDHLRGFSRTIPSFLMAYGDGQIPVTLASFDKIVPNPVFTEVTSISLDQFRFLRDGGQYEDEKTGEKKQFAGNLFDSVVFDDSVKEFLSLKKKFADYFDEKNIEDIFDYIPPQKTNLIFTPKRTVKEMVDMLEKENPGCFDDPSKTFIDLYMKSGLYITEIVKRLYQSKRLQELYPDPKARLRHIFEKQVYGLAPTEIIYRIALAYILGFNETNDITKHNFRRVDAVPYAKEGTLSELMDKLFGKTES